eukprot:6213841-Pleurochrysis_carterae.AAC.5
MSGVMADRSAVHPSYTWVANSAASRYSYSPIFCPRYGCIWFCCSLVLLPVTLCAVRRKDARHVLSCLYDDFVFVLYLYFASSLKLQLNSKSLMEDRIEVPIFGLRSGSRCLLISLLSVLVQKLL